MDYIAVEKCLVNKITNDPLYNGHWDWWLEKEQPIGVYSLERTYSKGHLWTWQVGRGIWAAIQTIFSLGLALISDYTRRTWQEAITGKERTIIQIMDARIGPINPHTETQSNSKNRIHKTHGTQTPTQNSITNPRSITNPHSIKNPPAPVAVPKESLSFNPVVSLDLSSFSESDAKLFKAIDETLSLVNDLEKSIGKKTLNASQKYNKQCPIDQILKVYNEILLEYQKSEYEKIDGPADKNLFKHVVGEKVPDYFANVCDGTSAHSKRYRSILGLRNLAKFGAEILDDLNRNLFHAKRDHYRMGKGLQRMFDLTGNTVDLESVLHAKTDEGAINEARLLIEVFKDKFKDFSTQFPDRNIENWPPHANVHESTSNTDRGNHPVWKRFMPTLQGYTHEYYANVPDIESVIGALLRTPLLFAQTYLIMKNKREDLASLFDDNSLSMKCFNNKYETAEKFNKEKRDTLKPSPRSIAIAKYGRTAVDSALDPSKLSEWLWDNNILPKADPKAFSELSKKSPAQLKEWVDQHLASQEKKLKECKPIMVNLYLDKLRKDYRKGVLLYDPVKNEYLPLNQAVIEVEIDKMVRDERANILAGMADEIRFF